MSEEIVSFSRSPALRTVRRGVTPQDMAVYAAIAGQPPLIDPPSPDGSPGTPARRSMAMTVRRAVGGPLAHSWSPAVLASYLRHFRPSRITLGVSVRKPEMAEWLRRVSDQAKERFHEAQVRLGAPKPPTRMTLVVPPPEPEVAPRKIAC